MSAGGPLGKSRVGRLRDRVLWRSPVRTQGATGQQKVTGWTDVAETWARVVSAAGVRELRDHVQQIAVGDFAVTVRGGTVDVGHDWSAVWDGLTLQVVAVVRDGSGIGSEVTVICREQQPATA